MSDERLDKQWQEKGLKDYSTKAILGTLEHYGVSIAICPPRRGTAKGSSRKPTKPPRNDLAEEQRRPPDQRHNENRKATRQRTKPD